MTQSHEFVGGTVLDDLLGMVPRLEGLPRHDCRPAWAVRVMRAVSTPRKPASR